MPVVTQITPQKRSENRRNVFLDGSFAFGCNLNVIARFRLREGQILSAEEIVDIQNGEVRQECFDLAIRRLESRLHSRSELKRKLMRKEFGETIIENVLNSLAEMNYLDDARFALNKAATAASRKHHGPRRAMLELMKAGVSSAQAKAATQQVYAQESQTLAIAMALAQRQVNRLQRLEPAVARRRLTGMLQRRGFGFDTIREVLSTTLGQQNSDER